MKNSLLWAYTVAIVGGAMLWLVTAAITGRREAWDSGLYWTVAYPLAIVLAGVLGYRVPERPWRWAWAILLAQAAVLAVADSDLSLLPLGLIMFSVLALPAMAVARMTAGIRLRKDKRTTTSAPGSRR